MKVHVSFTKGTQTKLQGKTEKYVVLIWVHDMWHHCAPYIHPYQLHDDCTRSLIFIFIFQVFLLQLFLAETFSSLVVIIGPRFQAIKLAQIKEKKFEKKTKRKKELCPLFLCNCDYHQKPHSGRLEECSCTFESFDQS